MSAAQKYFVLSLGCLFLACMFETDDEAQEQAKNASHSIVLGNGQKLPAKLFDQIALTGTNSLDR